MEVGDNSAVVRVGMLKVSEKAAYSGFIIYSKKSCGIDFINKLANGNITIDIMDTVGYYEANQTFSYFRDDKGKSSVTVQFGNPNPYLADTKTVLGSNRRDQFMVLFTGLNSVDFVSQGKSE